MFELKPCNGIDSNLFEEYSSFEFDSETSSIPWEYDLLGQLLEDSLDSESILNSSISFNVLPSSSSFMLEPSGVPTKKKRINLILRDKPKENATKEKTKESAEAGQIRENETMNRWKEEIEKMERISMEERHIWMNKMSDRHDISNTIGGNTQKIFVFTGKKWGEYKKYMAPKPIMNPMVPKSAGENGGIISVDDVQEMYKDVDSFPLFVWRTMAQWEYCGNYRVKEGHVIEPSSFVNDFTLQEKEQWYKLRNMNVKASEPLREAQMKRELETGATRLKMWILQFQCFDEDLCMRIQEEKAKRKSKICVKPKLPKREKKQKLGGDYYEEYAPKKSKKSLDTNQSMENIEMEPNYQELADPEVEYEVENILDVRVLIEGFEEYLIKFKGYPVPEWQPKHLINAPRIMKRFERSIGISRAKSKKGSKKHKKPKE
eukprot:TRINITY_DN206_c0_g2_i2.p1 TRINITY_DN206_c0_g2~~TRINITY_DN206_c0_g2_i2.p1  ORF type:complete len:466 (+),score=132.30 TRINITY_DN206_c0_g2_i2:104-1399(+)